MHIHLGLDTHEGEDTCTYIHSSCWCDVLGGVVFHGGDGVWRDHSVEREKQEKLRDI